MNDEYKRAWLLAGGAYWHSKGTKRFRSRAARRQMKARLR